MAYSANRYLYCMVVIFVLSEFCVFAADEYRPYLHNPSVGEYPKIEMYGSYSTGLFPGSATYSYPLEVPPGTGGLFPEIALSYNSQSTFQDPGSLGSGWELSLFRIQRNINFTLSDTSDDYYVLSLGSQQYKVVMRQGEYRTDIESYLKIELLDVSGHPYWKVTTKYGTSYRFGYFDESSLLSNNGESYVSSWYLDRIEDTHGNTIYYYYLENLFSGDEGAVYLSSIEYNLPSFRKVMFSYEDKPAVRTVFDQGMRTTFMKRLSEVSMFFNDSLVRRYSIDYVNLTVEGSLTAVSAISYYGSDNSSLFNSVMFDYFGEEPGFDNSTGDYLAPEAFSSISPGSQDLGIRLVDVNNDGFPDLVKAKDSTITTSLNDKSGSWEETSNFKLPVYLVDSDNNFQGVYFGDVNKDGLVDVIQSKNKKRSVFLNNGTGWENSSWSLGFDFIDGDGKDTGARLVDLNGDGLIDIVQGKGSTKAVYLNNGSEWINSSFFELPDVFETSDNKDTGLRILDLNGDGLVDLLKGGEPGNAWLNNGTGWYNFSSFAPSLTFRTDAEPDLGVRFMDVNGDRLTDIIQNFYSKVTIGHVNQTCVNETNSTENCTYYTYNVTEQTNVKINTGSGWVYNPVWLSPERFSSNGYNTGRRIADVNGDGYADIVVSFMNASLDRATQIRDAAHSYMLKSITTAYGGNIYLDYDKSSSKNNGEGMGFNMWLVSSVDRNNSAPGAFSAAALTSYDYYGGLYDNKKSEFRGFSVVNETASDSLVSHHFHQGDILKGRESETDVYGEDGTLYQKQVNSFSSEDYEVLLDFSAMYDYEGDESPVITNTSYTYDEYGNVLEAAHSGNIDFLGDEKFERYGYVYNTSAYIVDRKRNSTLLDQDMDVEQRTWYFYDNESDKVKKGDLTRVVRYDDLGTDPETVYDYDVFGNMVSQTDPNGNTNNYSYDSGTHTFAVSKTNALGHVTSFEYDRGTGNLLSETSNGLEKLYTYDVFGRTLKVVLPPDTITYPTKETTYYLDGSVPEKIMVGTKNNDSSYSESLYFYDGFGNPIQIKSKYDGTKQVVLNYGYDDKMRVDVEENPFFTAYSSSLTEAHNSDVTSYSYDALDRVLNVSMPDDSDISTVFRKSSVTSVNQKGVEKDYLLDAYNRIVNVQEHLDGQVFNTTYHYDARDTLVSIIDAKDNNISFEYDSLGRKVQMRDPDLGTWSYAYDGNGNLVSQTDSRNTTIALSYDALNRALSKVSGDLKIFFTYDLDYNGTLSKINYSSGLFKPIYYEYTYDERLRPIGESLFIDFVNRTQSEPEKDYWINTSVDYDSSDRIVAKYMPDRTYSYHFVSGEDDPVVLFPNSKITYNYNLLGAIKNIEGIITGEDYNSFGSVVNKSYANSVVTGYDYDVLNRVSEISSGSIMDLSYAYDGVGNIVSINDSVNDLSHAMEYDDLDRLTDTIISNFTNYEHERYRTSYDEIGNILNTSTDGETKVYSYASAPVHAPSSVDETVRDGASISLELIDPTSDTEVVQNDTFGFTVQACCMDNDCWGVNVSLDPVADTYSASSETHCYGSRCTTTFYSGTRFVEEDGLWKRVEDAKSLKGVWKVNVREDPSYPVQVIDFDYDSITLNVSSKRRLLSTPMKVYNKFNNSFGPVGLKGDVVDKGFDVRFWNDDYQQVKIDLSDTRESLLSQVIRWGAHSTIITVEDPSSTNIGDAYISGGSNHNYGSSILLYIENISSYPERHVMIGFDLSGIPREALVDNAEIWFYIHKNYLDSGDKYNVSVNEIYPSYDWSENTVTWSNRPDSTEMGVVPLDMKEVTDADDDVWFFWNVTTAVARKNANQSFYFHAFRSGGSIGTGDYIGFNSKEHAGSKPFLNVTYRLKGLVSNVVGETPFFSTVQNPYLVDLEEDECVNVSWQVNATGGLGRYLFFVFANKTYDPRISVDTQLLNVTVVGGGAQ